MKKLIVSDASTLILLEKILLLDKLSNNFNLVIPREIYDEVVIKGKEMKSADAYAIEEKINNNLIKIIKVKDKEKLNQIIEDFGLAKGETEAIVLFLQEKANALAIDDHKAINVCKIYKIPFITALTFIITAFDKKWIKEKEARKMINELGIYGRYKDELIQTALNYLDGDKND